MVKKDTLHDYYFEQQLKYEKKYGKDKTVVFMQVGSFHEAYNCGTMGYDLIELSKILNFRTSLKNKKEKVSISNPCMLGFPTIAFSKNLKILIDNGYTIIIIDQITPPPRPRREVTGIYSPGTYIEEAFSSDSNNIVCLYIENEIQKNGNTLMCIGMSVVDLSTGESCVLEVFAKSGDEKYALDEATRFIHSYSPKEIIIYMNSIEEKQKGIMKKESIILYLEIESKNYRFYETINKNYFNILWQDELLSKIYKDTGMLSPIEYINMEKYNYATISFVALMDFAFQHNENIINNLDKPKIFQNSRHLILGNNTVFQLNVLETDNFEGFNKRFKSLFNVVNNTSTAIGKRFLKNTLVAPLLNHDELNLRYNCIEEMIIEGKKYKKVEEYLKGILDLERLVRKLSLSKLNPFEFVNLYESYNESINLFKFLDKTVFIKEILPKKKVINNLSKFLKDYEKLFNIEEMKNSSLNDIQNNFFNKGIDKDIDKIQGEIDEGLFLLDNICSILSNYIDDKGKAKFIKKEDSKIYLKYNDRDGYYLSLTKLRAKSLEKNLEKLKKIKISDNYELEYKDLEFKELAKGNTKIFSKI
jgi:DNA mismatch repair protein MutS